MTDFTVQVYVSTVVKEGDNASVRVCHGPLLARDCVSMYKDIKDLVQHFSQNAHDPNIRE